MTTHKSELLKGLRNLMFKDEKKIQNRKKHFRNTF